MIAETIEISLGVLSKAIAFLCQQAEYVLNKIMDQNTRLEPFQQSMVDYAKNSVRVEIDTSMPTVEITCLTDEEVQIFLQGSEAEDFVFECEKMYDKYIDTNFDDLNYLVAYPYCDAMV